MNKLDLQTVNFPQTVEKLFGYENGICP